MRQIVLSALTALLLACAATSCNDEVFIDDFAPDVSDMAMSGSNDTRTIHFKSSKWDELSLVTDYTLDNYITVTPDGGPTTSCNTLQGDGQIALHNRFNDITVTRRGADVTVDVKYCIGHADELSVWLEARSTELNLRHSINISVNRVNGLEIDNVEYILDTWGTTGSSKHVLLSGLTIPPSAPGPVTWTPDPEGRIPSQYRTRTTSDDEDILNGLTGMMIPVPTNVNPHYREWALHGDEVPVSIYSRLTGLKHYPALPSISVNPGTTARLFAEMENVTFNAELKIRNTFSGEIYNIIMWLDIEQPIQFSVITDETDQ